MTLEDFQSHVRDYRLFEWRRGILFLCLLFSLAFPTLFVGRRIDRVGFDAIAIAVISVSYVIVAVLMFYVLVPMSLFKPHWTSQITLHIINRRLCR